MNSRELHTSQSDVPPVSRGAINRRGFIQHGSGALVSALAFTTFAKLSAEENHAPRFTLCLTPGSIGVQAFQPDLLRMAAQYGFESVEPYSGYLAMESRANIPRTLELMKSKKLQWGASNLSVDFRQSDALFNQGMAGLARLARALQEAGAPRIGTWISPSHATLTYTQNFKRHVDRLRTVATMLKDHGLRLGLEYVGTHTLLVRNKYPFIHTLAETRELIESIGTGNVGVVLDSWHWWQAGDTAEEIKQLRNEDVVSVDLNDAPAGIEKQKQMDNSRELPMATGVIPVEEFLKALVHIGYDGPVRAEPFNKPLNDMPNEPALEATAAAMKKAAALVRGKTS